VELLLFCFECFNIFLLFESAKKKDVAYPISDRFNDFLILRGHQSILLYEYNSMDVIT